MKKLTDVDRPGGMSDKQFLRHLRDKGHITNRQLKAASAHLNKIRGDGRYKHKMNKVLSDMDAGKVRIGGKVAASPEASAVMLKDVNPGASSKQKILELRKAGSLSPRQSREAAGHLRDGLTVEQAIEKVGATHLLETLPPRVDDDTEEEEVEAQDEPKGGEKSPATLGSILDGNLEELRGVVGEMENPKVLLDLLSLEVKGKDREGAKEAISDRASVMGATDEEIEQALDPGNFSGPVTAERFGEDLRG